MTNIEKLIDAATKWNNEEKALQIDISLLKEDVKQFDSWQNEFGKNLKKLVNPFSQFAKNVPDIEYQIIDWLYSFNIDIMTCGGIPRMYQKSFDNMKYLIAALDIDDYYNFID